MKLHEVDRTDKPTSYHDTITDAKGAAQHGLPDGVVAVIYRCQMGRLTQRGLVSLLDALSDGRDLPWDSREPVRRYIGQPGDGPLPGTEGQDGEGEA